MDDASAIWRSFNQEFSRLASRLDRVMSINVNEVELRNDVGRIALQYLREVRPIVANSGLNERGQVLDNAFTALLQLSEGRNALASYKKQIKRIRKTIPSVTTGLAIFAGTSRSDGNEPSADELKLLDTIGQLVPSAGLSYQQAIADLKDERRVSFRGAALELREVLREILDYLAPDSDVASAPGFKLEKDRKGPTMKQKVRFILKARGAGKTTSIAPEDSANTIDAMVGDLTRSAYTLSSIATHVASERRQVIQVKRYIDAVLHDILELN